MSWRRRFPEIDEALRKGREVCDAEVENALLKTALGGNFSAQVFWLKNRKGDVWREKPQGGAISEAKRAAYRALFAGPAAKGTEGGDA